MAQIMQIPVKTFPDGDQWLLLEPALGRRIVFRAHEIITKENVLDYDGHHGPEAHAKDSVKCKPRMWDISRDKIISC